MFCVNTCLKRYTTQSQHTTKSINQDTQKQTRDWTKTPQATKCKITKPRGAPISSSMKPSEPLHKVVSSKVGEHGTHITEHLMHISHILVPVRQKSLQ